jgi:hypothetical protein
MYYVLQIPHSIPGNNDDIYMEVYRYGKTCVKTAKSDYMRNGAIM